MLIRNAVSRYRLARILLGLETGRHVSMPGVEWIECTAYRLEPADATASYNDLDGEVIERGPIEGELLFFLPNTTAYFVSRKLTLPIPCLLFLLRQHRTCTAQSCALLWKIEGGLPQLRTTLTFTLSYL